jgi:transcription antitermination protein NusB
MSSDLTAAGKRERTGARRRAREFCLALLYAADSGGGRFDTALEESPAILASLFEVWELPFAEAAKLRPTVEGFGRRLYEQFLAHRPEIDARIEALSQGWTLDRMPVVDRNLLRMALAELLYLPDIPVGATIDEAVDLAKEYGTAESGKFINGILGAVARELQATPAPEPPEAE